jgi:hypothetical protein
VRRAFEGRWAPGTPFSWAYVLSAEYLSADIALRDGHRLERRSLFLFSRENVLRRLSLQMIRRRWWTILTMAVVALNTSCLFLEDPLSGRRPSLDAVYLVCACLFAAEAAISVVAYGLVLGRGAYLRRSWANVLDLALVALSLADVVAARGGGGGGGGNLTALRALRALRPLRTMSLLGGLRDATELLLHALPRCARIHSAGPSEGGGIL